MFFFYIILIYKFIDQQNTKSVIINSTIIFIAPLTFSWVMLSQFILFFIYFHNIYKNFKILYIFLSIAGFLISVTMPRLFFWRNWISIIWV